MGQSSAHVSHDHHIISIRGMRLRRGAWDGIGILTGWICTGPGIKACTWLREISSCSCLTVLPGPAWLLLNKISDFKSAYLYSGPCMSHQFKLIAPTHSCPPFFRQIKMSSRSRKLNPVSKLEIWSSLRGQNRRRPRSGTP